METDRLHTWTYPVAVKRHDDDGSYLATIPDLPGVMSHGPSTGEVLRLLRTGVTESLEALVDAAVPLPAPTRISMHRGEPEHEGCSWWLLRGTCKAPPDLELDEMDMLDVDIIEPETDDPELTDTQE